MDASLSRAAIVKVSDPHGWNSYDHYRTIHEIRLVEHPYVDDSRQNTIKFEFIELDGVLYLHMEGQCFCHRNVILEVALPKKSAFRSWLFGRLSLRAGTFWAKPLEVEKVFETRYVGTILQVRGIMYRYVAWVKGGNLIVKYHNLHEDPDEYIHRAYDPETGSEILYESLTRSQFPLFTEVLDEIQLLTVCLES